MRQLVYTEFIRNNCVSFHLWWKKNLVRHQKVSKYYKSYCRSTDYILSIKVITSIEAFNIYFSSWNFPKKLTQVLSSVINRLNVDVGFCLYYEHFLVLSQRHRDLRLHGWLFVLSADVSKVILFWMTKLLYNFIAVSQWILRDF